MGHINWPRLIGRQICNKYKKDLGKMVSIGIKQYLNNN